MKRLTASLVMLVVIVGLGCELTPDQQAMYNEAPVVLTATLADMQNQINAIKGEIVNAPPVDVPALEARLRDLEKAQGKVETVKAAVDAATTPEGNVDPTTGIGALLAPLFGPYGFLATTILALARAAVQKARLKRIVGGIEALKVAEPTVAAAFKSTTGKLALATAMGDSGLGAVAHAKGEKFGIPLI